VTGAHTQYLVYVGETFLGTWFILEMARKEADRYLGSRIMQRYVVYGPERPVV
jgi:hypothetical protein